MVSDSFTAVANDVITFRWYPKFVSDDFAVVAYLQKSDCSKTLLLSASGSNIANMIPAGTGTGWQDVSVTIPSSGSYRFVFVNGTFDRSGGTIAGAELYISDISSGQPQTITFNQPGVQFQQAGPLTLEATASSGLPVSYQSSTTSVCTVSGSSVTFVTTGTCTIQARQPGDSTFAAAPPVTRTFTIAAGIPFSPLTLGVLGLLLGFLGYRGTRKRSIS